MALATECPACNTVFRISTAQATAKGGTVRCGQCRHVFNSLDALVRVEDLEVIEEVQVALPATVDDGTAAAPQPRPDIAPEPDSTVSSESVDADTGASQSVVQDVDPAAAAEAPADADATDESQPRPDERPATGEWWLPDPADRDATPIVAQSPAIDDREDAGILLTGRGIGDLQTTGSGADAVPAFLASGTSPTRLGRSARRTLGILSSIAAIALVAQLAYLWRDEIAVRWPAARPWLTAACGPLRCTVGYPAHLDWITIESATIQATGAGLDVYVLNALLRNRASSDVRYPHLELVLTDLQDRPILRRALRPEDYLPAGRNSGRDAAGRGDDATAPTGFAADTELPIHLTFELGDLRFAGYRVDKFYP